MERVHYDCKKKYIIEKIITEDSGGCLRTVIAKDGNLNNRRVVLKEMSYENSQQKEEILKEISNHVLLEQYTDNTPKIYNVFENKQEIVAEMQLMPGRSLREILEKNNKKEKNREWYNDTYNLFIKICKSVSKIHSIRIPGNEGFAFVHKDLKPENIIIPGKEKNEDAYIIDFGISGPGMSKGIGTPKYMAPEQHEHVKYDVKQATDVYALGQIGIEMFIGQPLDYGKDIIFNTRGDTWAKEKDLTGIGSNAYPNLATILKKAIAMNPADRYQNARELVKALKDSGNKNGRK